MPDALLFEQILGNGKLVITAQGQHRPLHDIAHQRL